MHLTDYCVLSKLTNNSSCSSYPLILKPVHIGRHFGDVDTDEWGICVADHSETMHSTLGDNLIVASE